MFLISIPCNSANVKCFLYQVYTIQTMFNAFHHSIYLRRYIYKYALYFYALFMSALTSVVRLIHFCITEYVFCPEIPKIYNSYLKNGETMNLVLS